MGAGTLFAINFLAYAIVFMIVVVLVVAACFIGITWRKSKDAKIGLDDEFSEIGSKA